MEVSHRGPRVMTSTGLPSHFQGRFQKVVFGLSDEDESKFSPEDEVGLGKTVSLRDGVVGCSVGFLPGLPGSDDEQQSSEEVCHVCQGGWKAHPSDGHPVWNTGKMLWQPQLQSVLI